MKSYGVCVLGCCTLRGFDHFTSTVSIRQCKARAKHEPGEKFSENSPHLLENTEEGRRERILRYQYVFLRSAGGSRPCQSWLSCFDIGADHLYQIASGFKGLFSVVTRNKSSVVIERHISFPAKPVEHGQKAKMLFVDPCPDEFDNRDVMPWLTPGAETVAEHEPQGSLQHCFVGLLEAGLFVESENLLCGRKFLFGALQEALNLRPVYLLRLKLLHAALRSETRLLCQTFSRKASFRFRRDSNSFLLKTV